MGREPATLSDDFSEAELKAFKANLMSLKTSLEETLSATTKSAQTVDLDEPIGRISRMDALTQQSMARAQKRRHEIRLSQVLAALRAMNDDDYGLCTACDDSIEKARLEIRPESPMCHGCQSAIEKRR